MIPEQRQREVLHLLPLAGGVLGIREIADHLKVSPMTVRRDISGLEKSGKVVMVRGGVRLARHASIELHPECLPSSQPGLARDRAIAGLAVSLLREGAVIFLDEGRTCASMVPFLAKLKGLTVVTNNYYVTGALLHHSGIEAIHVGGTVDVECRSSSGPLSEATLALLNLDVCFLSTGSWDLRHGITTPSIEKAALKRAASAAASTSVLLADSTRFDSFQPFPVLPLTGLEAVITDSELDGAAREALRILGIDVHLGDY